MAQARGESKCLASSVSPIIDLLDIDIANLDDYYKQKRQNGSTEITRGSFDVNYSPPESPIYKLIGILRSSVVLRSRGRGN